MNCSIRSSQWQRLAAATCFALLAFTTTSSAQWSRSDSCREYARDYSMRYSRDGFMGGVVRGALGGAVIGGIAGGGRGAGRGAGAGALLGGATRGIQSSTLFDRAYSRCMRGRWP